jgi:hypothetical protein
MASHLSLTSEKDIQHHLCSRAHSNRHHRLVNHLSAVNHCNRVRKLNRQLKSHQLKAVLAVAADLHQQRIAGEWDKYQEVHQPDQHFLEYRAHLLKSLIP